LWIKTLRRKAVIVIGDQHREMVMERDIRVIDECTRSAGRALDVEYLPGVIYKVGRNRGAIATGEL
jgi:hypothetical protein